MKKDNLTLLQREALERIAQDEERMKQAFDKIEASINNQQQDLARLARSLGNKLTEGEKQTIRDAIRALGTCSHCDNIDPSAYTRIQNQLKLMLKEGK